MMQGIDERLIKVILENSQEGVLLLDRRGNILKVNQSFSLMSGYRAKEMLGRNIRRFTTAESNAEFIDDAIEGLWQDGFWQGEITQKKKNNESLHVFLRLSAVLPARGSIRFFVVQITEVADQLNEQELAPRDKLTTDPVTGLPTKGLLLDRIQQAISQAERQHHSVGVLYLGLDGARVNMINSSLGRDKGDLFLKEVTVRLKKCLRTSDSVARISATTFGLMLADVSDGVGAVRNAGVVARKIYESLSEPIMLGEREIDVTAHMGMTLYPQDGAHADELIKNAETALAFARKKGLNNYQFFSTEMTETARKRFELEGNLRLAIDRKELCLYYQPQVCLETGKVIGAEGLIRWIHPELGMISPGEFIPIAEETGLIVPIGSWVLKTACYQLAEWQKKGLPPIRMGVNISAMQFKRNDLAKQVKELLDETGIDPSMLDLEITESAIISDVQKTVETLNQISDLGVKLSIDDFGTGYSSLSQLRQFPFKTLKIDRSFIRDITSNSNAAAIVSAIIAMAHSLNQTVIVEGLETEDQLTIMRELHANEIQGFLFSAAVPADQLTKMLQDNKKL
ncbi:MAG: EAL domain-containing protein [Magnetococcales bacterium]|nr:EAL domain-containing protein [Magnetococcales bacterium]